MLCPCRFVERESNSSIMKSSTNQISSLGWYMRILPSAFSTDVAAHLLPENHDQFPVDIFYPFQRVRTTFSKGLRMDVCSKEAHCRHNSIVKCSTKSEMPS